MARDAPSLVTTTLPAPGRPAQLVVRRAALRPKNGPDAGATREIAHTPWVLGKHPSCDLVLDDSTVSSRHAEIVLAPGGYLMRDLDSRNGLFVDRWRVGEVYLAPSMVLALGHASLEVVDLQQENAMALSPAEQLGRVIGRSPLMRHVFAVLESAAASNAPLLLEGESGTGKTMLAEALHAITPRGAGPFVVFDCGAVPRQLVESELFGHERGAFTGAVESRAGVLEQAAGGTLFLDEVAELNLEVQPKLLRAIERHQFRRLGASETRTVDVRIVAASNQDLGRLVDEGRFRRDLYYRLAVLRVRVPPLRERREDLPLLVDRFWRAEGNADDIQRRYPGLRALLSSYRWPGNVRELRNLIERLAVLPLQDALPSAVRVGGDPSAPVPFPEARDRALAQFELSYLREMLERSGGNVTRAAELAGVSRRYLTQLLARHGIERQDFAGR